MAASLGIHRADIRIVSVYEGSTIIDFEVISNIADEFPLSLDDVEEDFILLMQATEEFMGVPLLGASSSRVPIVTPNTPTGEEQEALFENIWDEKDDGSVDPTVVAEEDQEKIKVDIVYNDITVN